MTEVSSAGQKLTKLETQPTDATLGNGYKVASFLMNAILLGFKAVGGTSRRHGISISTFAPIHLLVDHVCLRDHVECWVDDGGMNIRIVVEKKGDHMFHVCLEISVRW